MALLTVGGADRPLATPGVVVIDSSVVPLLPRVPLFRSTFSRFLEVGFIGAPCETPSPPPLPWLRFLLRIF